MRYSCSPCWHLCIQYWNFTTFLCVLPNLMCTLCVVWGDPNFCTSNFLQLIITTWQMFGTVTWTPFLIQGAEIIYDKGYWKNRQPMLKVSSSSSSSSSSPPPPPPPYHHNHRNNNNNNNNNLSCSSAICWPVLVSTHPEVRGASRK